MKRTLLIFTVLCLLTAIPLFASSCKNDGKEPAVTAIDPGALIAGGEESVYSVVYPAHWEDYEMNAASDLKYAFSASYSSFPKLIDDSKPESEYEILIGNTNRPESSAVLEGLNDYGWVVRVMGNKIVINAKKLAVFGGCGGIFCSHLRWERGTARHQSHLRSRRKFGET